MVAYGLLIHHSIARNRPDQYVNDVGLNRVSFIHEIAERVVELRILL